MPTFVLCLTPNDFVYWRESISVWQSSNYLASYLQFANLNSLFASAKSFFCECCFCYINILQNSSWFSQSLLHMFSYSVVRHRCFANSSTFVAKGLNRMKNMASMNFIENCTHSNYQINNWCNLVFSQALFQGNLQIDFPTLTWTLLDY